MKAHFGKGDYDFVTYKGKTRIKRDTFYKRKDRSFFVKLARKYKYEEEIKNYFIANFIKDKKDWWRHLQGGVRKISQSDYQHVSDIAKLG